MRPRSVSATARGCSWISLSMKCLKPPFSAGTASSRCGAVGGSPCSPARSSISTPAAVSTAISPSSRNITLRVCARIAGMSEATKFSPSPRPSTSGEAFLAATIGSGSLSRMTTIA